MASNLNHRSASMANKNDNDYYKDMKMSKQPSKEANSNIRNVWVENFEEELPIISELLEKYPYIAMVNLYHTYFPNSIRIQSFLE